MPNSLLNLFIYFSIVFGDTSFSETKGADLNRSIASLSLSHTGLLVLKKLSMCCLWHVETFASHFVKIFKKYDIKFYVDNNYSHCDVLFLIVFFLEFLSDIVCLMKSICF